MSPAVSAHLWAGLARRSSAVQVGPFMAGFDPGNANPYLNYAVPDQGARPDLEDVATLVAAFRAHERMPRLEYVPDDAPEVEAALLAAGFAEEARLPLMTATAATIATDTPVPDGYVVRIAADPAERAAAGAAQSAAFGGSSEGDAREDLVADGGAVAIALAPDGSAVGGGTLTAPAAGTAEVAGIGVRADHRRRGLATALTAELARAAVARGIAEPFLTPGDDGARAAYERAGFRAAGAVLHIRLES